MPARCLPIPILARVSQLASKNSATSAGRALLTFHISKIGEEENKKGEEEEEEEGEGDKRTEDNDDATQAAKMSARARRLRQCGGET